MNTIKIYLAESGRIADLKKDFPLYQYQFQNKLLNIYVPTSIMAPDFTSQNANGTVLSEYIASTAVKIGMTYTSRDGSIKKSRNYYMRYLKTLTYQGVEYALYERKLPKEFTLYAGQGINAPVLVANVVNIQQETEQGEPIVLSITASQTCALDVMPSTNLDIDEAIEPSELDIINADINEINEILALKQDKTDPTIQLEQFPSEHTVVGSINKIGSQVKTNTDQIEENRQDIAENRNDIDYLKQNVALPEDYIGQMTGTSLPSQSQLTQFVVSTVGRQPKNADVVIFVQKIAGSTDKNYKYVYSAQGWNGYEIPPMEEAFNGSLGLIQGTYGIDNTGTLVDISGGKIVHIYTKDENGVYRDIQTYLNELQEYIDNIISGNTSVGKALRAVSDELGNNIVDTYLTQTLGASKQWVKDYALPRTFNDIYFIESTGYTKEVPTSISGVQFTRLTNSVGDFQIFQIERTNDADFELSAKNSSNNNIFIASNRDCAVYFRLTTEVKKQGRSWTTLAVELSNKTILTADEISKVTFGTSFTSLGETVLSLTDNDMFRQTLEVITEESIATTFTVYSNETYPSTFNLNTQTYTPSAIERERGNLLMLGATGVVEGGNAVFTVEDGEYFEEYKTNQREFLIDLILPVAGDIDNSLSVRIEFGDAVYNVFDILKGATVPITIGDLAQVGRYDTNIGYRYICKMMFFANASNTGFAIIPTVSLSDILSLSGTQMTAYETTGGLKQGQTVLCNTSGGDFEIGNFYKFEITYPNTYHWELITAGTTVIRLTE